jgi:hypothetical protein
VPSPAMADGDTRSNELRKRSDELNEAVKQLPGRDAASDRQLVADAFAKASSSLELLGGPMPGGALRQELRIIDNTRVFLASGSPVSPDPSTDTGLRSLESALTNVRERSFPSDEKVKAELDALRQRIGDLDSVRGPIHSLVVAQVFQSASSVIDMMSTELESRGGAQPASAVQAPGR